MNETTTQSAIGFVVLAALLVPAHARADSVTIAIPAVQAAPAGEVTVPISAIGAQGMGPLQFELLYDPDLLQVAEEAVVPGAGAGGAMIEFNASEPGRLRVAMISGQPLEGDGELMMVRFTARGQSGQTGDLTIADARAWTFQDILEMRVTPKNGSVVLITTRAAIPTPLLLLAGGLVLIVGLVLVFRPRRSPRRPSAPTRAHPARHYS